MVSGWRLEYRGTEIDIASRKARALLAFLALSKDSKHSRETIASMLWGEEDSLRARASLRQVLSGLGRALEGFGPPLLLSSGEDIGLAGGLVASDVDSALDAIRDGLPDDAGRALVLALPKLLRDLAGASPGFDTWVAQTAHQLVGLAQRRLQAIHADEAQPIDLRIRAAQTAYALDDLDEDAVCTLMDCHARAGNSTAALRIYGAFHARLQDELDAEPSRRTQDLAVEIKLMQVPLAEKRVTPAAAARAPLATVAVMPFEFLGFDPTPDFMILGLLDQITCHLASFRAPAVISSNSTRRYRGALPDLARISAELHAKYVVTGSVLRHGDEATIAVQLVEAATGLVLWASTYRCDVNALFDVRTSIAESIARTVLPSVNLAELRLANTAPVESLEPYHLVLRAKDLIFRLEPAAFRQAGTLLEQAVAAEPLFAPAHALLGEWFALRLLQGWSDRQARDRQALETHVTRAIALSPGDGRAMALWGHCRVMFERDYPAALRLFEQAISVQPNDSETLVWTVPTLAYSEQTVRAVDHARRAIDLSPVDPFLFRNEHFLSLALFCDGQFDEAADLGLSCFRRAPDYSSNLRMTIASLSAAGRISEAAPLVRHHALQVPDFSVRDFMPGHGLRDAAARETFGKLLVAAGMPR